MNRANGTIRVTATNYKPNLDWGVWNALRLGKTSAGGNLVDRIEVELVFVDVGEFGGVRRFFLKGT